MKSLIRSVMRWLWDSFLWGSDLVFRLMTWMAVMYVFYVNSPDPILYHVSAIAGLPMLFSARIFRRVWRMMKYQRKYFKQRNENE